MEGWQINHINRNLSSLIRLTRFNILVKAELVAQNILDDIDVDDLDALQTQRGQIDMSFRFYKLLKTRPNAYKVLTRTLLDNRQTDAVRILIDGVPANVYDKPLTYLGISTELDGFKDMEIEVNGKKLKLHQFMPSVNFEKLHQIFKETVSELEIYDTFLMKQRTFVLASNTIPPKPLIYLPRFLSNRIKIDQFIFKVDCPDVFAFKKSLPRYKLSEIAKPYVTETSTSQLTKITCRFIHLDENEDWIELKTLAKVPIHLINYEAKGNIFLLEDSSSPSNILKILNSKNERVYMTEEDFVQQQLSEDCMSSSICICDTPGMGKTYLLANFARLMAERCTGRLVVFISLSALCSNVFPDSTNTILNPDESLSHVLKFVLPSGQNPELLLKLIRDQIIQMEIFFDGFDEIPSEKVKWTKQVFKLITTSFRNTRIYITSRPHMRQDLETSLGVVAFDILPFNQQNQIDYLVQCWQNKSSKSDQLSLHSYATSCLEALNESLTKHDKEIAGIPLLCQLIAEIYADRVTLHSAKRKKFSDVPLQIYGMYQKFIEQRISIVGKTKEEFDKFILVYVWHALKLLFRRYEFDEDSLFENVKDLLTSPEILRTGILQKNLNGSLDFIHRTFAEYIVVEYFWSKLQDAKTLNTKCSNRSMSPLQWLLKSQFYFEYSKWKFVDCTFANPVIVSFFNSALGEGNISEEMKIQGALYISYSMHENFMYTLCACCQNNLFNVFLFLKDALGKCNKTWIKRCFTYENCYNLLKVCIERSTGQMFHSCIELFTKVPKLDLERIVTFEEDGTIMQMAVACGNYEAVDYFVDRASLKNLCLLKKCVEHSENIENRENILHLLLSKEPTLIHETPNILVINYEMDVRLFKILAKFGAIITAVNAVGENCTVHLAIFMSPRDYHTLVQFLLNDCKAEYLFLDNDKWKNPLPYIIERVTLLPETMELLLSIPGMDINMRDENGENLLFSAVKGYKLENLRQLGDRGLDYNERGICHRSLLHAAVFRDRAMIEFLSLKLDTNSHDADLWTPLHHAAAIGKLLVLEVLVENGANVNAKNNFGHTALHMSAHTSCTYANIEVIKYLIRKRAGLNDRDNYGNTPLHLCRRKEARDCLIEMGADIHAKNSMNETPKQMNPALWI